MKNIFKISGLLILLFSACKKESVLTYDPGVKSVLLMEFDNIAGSSDLQLNSGLYTNEAGEHFSVTKLKYFVSNFTLTNTDGSKFTVPQDSCYFLIDESDETTHQPVIRVPEGEYKTISFVLGVDSLRNIMDITRRSGVLDPAGSAAGMYWGRDSGYVFFSIEGLSTTIASPGTYSYHIGGYGGPTSPVINNLKTITLDLSARGVPKVKTGREPNIHLMVDILKFFDGTTRVSIADRPVVMFEDYSSTIANNFTNMFRHDHTENE